MHLGTPPAGLLLMDMSFAFPGDGSLGFQRLNAQEAEEATALLLYSLQSPLSQMSPAGDAARWRSPCLAHTRLYVQSLAP